MPGRGVALAGAALLGLLLDPLAQLQHLGAHRALGDVDQRALVVGHALADPVQAGVVGAALEHGVRRLLLEHRPAAASSRRGMSRSTSWCCSARVAVATTTRSLVQQRRHEVAQRLAGAGAGLDEQVLAGRHRAVDGLGHLDLAGALLPAERLDRGGEDLLDFWHR